MSKRAIQRNAPARASFPFMSTFSQRATFTSRIRDGDVGTHQRAHEQHPCKRRSRCNAGCRPLLRDASDIARLREQAFTQRPQALQKTVVHGKICSHIVSPPMRYMSFAGETLTKFERLSETSRTGRYTGSRSQPEPQSSKPATWGHRRAPQRSLSRRPQAKRGARHGGLSRCRPFRCLLPHRPKTRRLRHRAGIPRASRILL